LEVSRRAVDILSATLAHFLRLFITVFGTFAAANIDHLFVLLVFFTDKRSASWQIVTGPYLGLSAIIGVCLIGATAASHVPSALVRALGIIPIAVGVHRLFNREAKVRQTIAHSTKSL
jgi:cadmium resistance protein CadD (predicted permease)